MKPSNLCLEKIVPSKRSKVLWLIKGLLVLSMSSGAQAESSRVIQYIEEINSSILQSNISVIEQIGNNNHASVIQSRSASYQLANFSHIHQRGNNNKANIIQNNGNNIGVIWQIGNDHIAQINQQGNSLSLRADIFQTGFKSDITISQSGSGLRGISVQQQNNSGSARPVTIDNY